MTNTYPEYIITDLQRSVFDARERTGNPIGTQIKAGKLRVVCVTYNKRGTSTVTPLSDWLGKSEAIDFLSKL